MRFMLFQSQKEKLLKDIDDELEQMWGENYMNELIGALENEDFFDKAQIERTKSLIAQRIEIAG